MSTFIQLVVSGLALGAVYALVALGFVIIYRASQVFNFAQGELLSLGAFLMVALCGVGLPWGGLGLFVNVGYQQALVARDCDVFIAGESDNLGFRFAVESGVSFSIPWQPSQVLFIADHP